MDRPAGTSLRIGAWCVNPTAGQISRDGETVRVEARTMRLLLCLAEHAGRVVSIDDLLDQVWSGVIVSSDSVYQAVASLRRILGDDPKQPRYIATVPRLGYRMVATVSEWTESTPASQVSLATTDDRSAPTGDTAIVQARRSVRLRMAVTAACVALALVGGMWFQQRQANDAQAARLSTAVRAQKSIAVMTFLDLTEQMDQEYFADEMTEDLIDKLSKLPDLRVPPPRDSFYFKDKQVTVTEIAKSLGVAYVLDGSLRESGSSLRVTARLVRADNGFIVWSETYERALHDMPMIQDDIAARVVNALNTGATQ